MTCCGNSNHGQAFDPECEAPLEEDVARFGGDGITCPSCDADVYHDAAMCGACGHAMVKEPSGPRSPWIRVTAVVVTIAFLLVFVL